MRNATSIGLFGASALALTVGASFLGACGGGGSGSGDTAGTTSTGGTPSTGGISAGGTPAAGGNSTAGSSTGGASGGAPTCAMTPGPKAGDGMNTDIDNLDDMNTMFAPAGTGSGSWDWGKDTAGMGMITPAGTMTLTPVAGGQMGNGLHITGTGVTGWGASLAAFLNGPTSAFDASKYGGIAFYMKGTTNVQEGMNKLMVQARMPDVLPGPGSCCSDSVKGSECYSGHRVVIDVPADWKEVKIAWGDFKGPTWGLGASIALNPNRIRDINFSFNHDTMAKDMNPISFDVWVDGVRFLKMDEMGNVTGGNTGGAGGMGSGGASGAGGAGGGGAGGLGGTGGGGNGGMGGM